MSFNLRKSRKVLLIVLSAIMVLLGVFVIKSAVKSDNQSKKREGIDFAANDGRTYYLNLCGWEVSEQPLSEREITIPYEFNDTYEKYNQLQLKQGFDLSDYKGKKVELCTYEVKNYYDDLENVRVNMLIDGSKLIGGEVFLCEKGGFMCGFMEEKT